MRALVIGLVLTAIGVAMAQQPAQTPEAPKTFTSAADVTALIAKTKADGQLKAGAAPGRRPHPALRELQREDLEYRRAVAARRRFHEHEAEIFLRDRRFGHHDHRWEAEG